MMRITRALASKLKNVSPKIDHDVCSNYGNWLYSSAGIGNDPRENRKFNMIKQGLDYDNNVSIIECLVKRYINSKCYFFVEKMQDLTFVFAVTR